MPPGFPAERDPNGQGSRFTGRVALAFTSRRHRRSIYENDPDRIDSRGVVRDALGADPKAFSEFGRGVVVDGGYGRGASGSAAVVEWTLDAIGTGVMGAAAWAAVTSAARRMRALVEELWAAEVRFLVSRGTAIILAIAHVLEHFEETEVLDVEAATEPSSLRGMPASELNYVGAEPWLVALVNRPRTMRYIAAVEPDGRISGVLSLPMSEDDALYFDFPNL